MPTNLPNLGDAPLLEHRSFLRQMVLVSGITLFLLAPSLLLILIAAAFLGHGQISFESIVAVFAAAGESNP
jgi:hypothetical protein